MRELALESFDLIISGLRLSGAPGTTMIQLAAQTAVLIMTSYASLRSAVDTIKMGAVDYIAKPFDYDDMLQAVANTLRQKRETVPVTETRPTHSEAEKVQLSENPAGIIGQSQIMQTLFNHINRVAPTEATVLVFGEFGTGKELVARALHETSKRSQQTMISVNCAAIPETLIESEPFGHEKVAFTGAATTRNGLIEAADGSTLFPR